MFGTATRDIESEFPYSVPIVGQTLVVLLEKMQRTLNVSNRSKLTIRRPQYPEITLSSNATKYVTSGERDGGEVDIALDNGASVSFVGNIISIDWKIMNLSRF